MVTDVARQRIATDTVNGIQQKIDALAKEVERLNDSPRKRALRVALAEIRARGGGASRKHLDTA